MNSPSKKILKQIKSVRFTDDKGQSAIVTRFCVEKGKKAMLIASTFGKQGFTDITRIETSRIKEVIDLYLSVSGAKR